MPKTAAAAGMVNKKKLRLIWVREACKRPTPPARSSATMAAR
jgi:hypothetical protein